MSYLYSRALVAEFFQANSLDGELFAPSNSTPTPQAYLSQDKMTVFSRPSLSGMTFAPLTENHGKELLTWFQAGFPARTSASAAKAQDSTVRVPGYGRKCEESLAKFNQDSSSWKTRQCSLFGGGGQESLEIWPRWATWDATAVWEDSPSMVVQTVSACGSSLLRPTAQGWKAWTFKNLLCLVRRNHADGNIQEQSARCFHRMITPESNEILLMWPQGWTDLKPLGMDRIRQWLRSHGIFCQDNKRERCPESDFMRTYDDDFLP